MPLIKTTKSPVQGNISVTDHGWVGNVKVAPKISKNVTISAGVSGFGDFHGNTMLDPQIGIGIQWSGFGGAF